MLTAVLLGFVLGLRHAFDPDHVVAVSTVVARHHSPWTASWIGVSWGAGHALTILLVGACVVALQITIPEGLARSMELLIGVLLIALGVANLVHPRAVDDGAPAARNESPLGAALARSEGFGIISRIQNELASGQLPGDSLIDGSLVLAGALFLLTPGLITDAFGFALLLPFSRAFVKIYLKKYFSRKINTGEIQVNYKIEDS